MEDRDDAAFNTGNNTHQKALCAELWRLRKEAVMCDVTLDIQGAATQLCAHRVILSASSPRLKSLCTSTTGASQEGNMVMSIGNHSYSTCLRVLEFLYTGHCGVLMNAHERGMFSALCDDWEVKKPDAFLTDLDELGKRVNRVARKRTSWYKCGRKQCKKMRTEPLGSEEKFVESEGLISEVQSDLSRRETLENDDLNKIGVSSENLVSEDSFKSENLLLDDPIIDDESDFKNKETSGRQNGVEDAQSETMSQKETHLAAKPTKIQGKTGKRRKSGRNRKTQRLPKPKVKVEKCESSEKLGMYVGVECKVCETRFRDRNLLLAHNVEHHWSDDLELPQIFTCEFPSCSYKTHNRWSWNAHRTNAHLTDRVICDMCGKSLKNEVCLKQHKINLHSAAPHKQFTCDTCHKIFKAEVNLQKHMRQAHLTELEQRETFICPYCAHTCLRSASLTEHLYKKHDILPPNGKGYQCQHCDFKSINPAELKRHEPRHRPESEQPFRCDQCERAFPTKGQLTEHLKKHSGVKLHRCNYCEYSSKYAHNLQAHVLVRHEKTDYKPWICDECSYCCNSKGNLYKHLRNVHKRTVNTKWSLNKVTQASNGTERGPGPLQVKGPGIKHTSLEVQASGDTMKGTENAHTKCETQPTILPEKHCKSLPEKHFNGLLQLEAQSLPLTQSELRLDAELHSPQVSDPQTNPQILLQHQANPPPLLQPLPQHPLLSQSKSYPDLSLTQIHRSPETLPHGDLPPLPHPQAYTSPLPQSQKNPSPLTHPQPHSPPLPPPQTHRAPLPQSQTHPPDVTESLIHHPTLLIQPQSVTLPLTLPPKHPSSYSQHQSDSQSLPPPSPSQPSVAPASESLSVQPDCCDSKMKMPLASFDPPSSQDITENTLVQFPVLSTPISYPNTNEDQTTTSLWRCPDASVTMATAGTSTVSSVLMTQRISVQETYPHSEGSDKVYDVSTRGDL